MFDPMPRTSEYALKKYWKSRLLDKVIGHQGKTLKKMIIGSSSDDEIDEYRVLTNKIIKIIRDFK